MLCPGLALRIRATIGLARSFRQSRLAEPFEHMGEPV
jgi:hypothetical protein